MRQSTAAPRTGAADELIKEIINNSAQQPEPTPERPGPGRVSVLPVAGAVLVLVLTVWNVLRYSSDPEGFTPEGARTYMRIVSASTAIEAFSDSAGHLPASLSQIPAIDRFGLSYMANGESFTLSVVVDGTSVDYRRGTPILPPVGFDALVIPKGD